MDGGTGESPAHKDGERWNFRVLLGQGTFASIATELTSEKLVLPFLATAVGAPVIVAGMVVPVVRVSKLGAQILAAPAVASARQNKWYLVAASAMTAFALTAVCLLAGVAAALWLAVAIVAAAAILGAAEGLGSLAFQDLLGRILPARHRSRLLFTQSGIAGVVAVAVAVATQTVIQSSTPLASHIELVWAGIAMTVVAILFILGIREPHRWHPATNPRPPRGPVLAEIRDNFRKAVKLPWLRRFLVARSLFLSVELAMPFYAIHAATLHGGSHDGLGTFVIASSVGLVLGGVLWPRIGRDSVRLVLIAGALVTCLGGVLAIVIDGIPTAQRPILHAAVFVLVAFGAQGIMNGRTVYIVGAAAEHERTYCIAAAGVFTGALSIGVAMVLGIIAHVDVLWPMVAVVGFNLVAAGFALTLPDVRPPPAGDGKAAASAAGERPPGG